MSHDSECDFDPDFPTADDSNERHFFHCDNRNCASCYDGLGTFHEVWDEAKASGWRCRKVDDHWQHYCPEHVRGWRNT